MASYLLAITMGPVVPFLTGTRRTRDLWGASSILSDLSRAIAIGLQKSGCQMIVPGLISGAELDSEQVTSVDVPDLIFAVSPELESVAAAQQTIKKACQEAQDLWERLGERTLKASQAHVDVNRFREQLKDVWDFSYAAVVLEGEGEFRRARARVMEILAATENTRCFAQSSGPAGLPKSSLDGRRDTVWKSTGPPEQTSLGKRLRLSAGEHLDAIGLTKRIGKDTRAFPSVSRIAAEPWLAQLSEGDRQSLAAHCEAMTQHGLIQINTARYPAFRNFPYEATIVYPSREKEIWEDEGPPNEAHDRLIEERNRLLAGYGDASPYFAVLAADGDHLTIALNQAETPEAHRDFSILLSRFTDRCRTIVQQDFHGCVIFAGGDDLLALLPVTEAIACAEALHDEFGGMMGGPTLSMALVIGHHLESLEDHVGRAFRALFDDAKKPDRDGLAIHYHPRGGASISVRGQWKGGISDRLRQGIKAYSDGTIPHRLAYEIEELAVHYEGWDQTDELLKGAINADLKRLLAKKEMEEAKREELLSSLGGPIRTASDLRKFGRELLIAQRLVQSAPQSQMGRAQ